MTDSTTPRLLPLIDDVGTTLGSQPDPERGQASVLTLELHSRDGRAYLLPLTELALLKLANLLSQPLRAE